MRLPTMRIAFSFLGAALTAVLLVPADALAQGAETAVPVGPAPVGMGPNGATLRCRDGFFPAPGAPDAACQDHGGVLARFPLRRTPSRAAEAQAAARTEGEARRAARGASSTSAAMAAARSDSARPAGFEPIAVRRARADSLNRAANTRPDGATLLCTDGTWIVRDTVQARCRPHGGVRVVFPPAP